MTTATKVRRKTLRSIILWERAVLARAKTVLAWKWKGDYRESGDICNIFPLKALFYKQYGSI